MRCTRAQLWAVISAAGGDATDAQQPVACQQGEGRGNGGATVLGGVRASGGSLTEVCQRRQSGQAICATVQANHSCGRLNNHRVGRHVYGLGQASTTESGGQVPSASGS